jgi:hypothetical protein
MTFRKFFAAVLTALLLVLITMAYATKAYEQDALEIQNVIQLQLYAVMQEDAEMAFSFASALSQDELGSPADFMDLIRHDFPMMYRYRQVQFDEYDIDVNHATQIVHFTDENNAIWIGVYRMLRETDGAWKIAGCQLFETASISI